MNHQLHHAVDAYLASPSITPMLPPPVGVARPCHHPNPTNRAKKDRHPLAHLMRLRDEADAEIERLLTFLDLTEGDLDVAEADCSEQSDDALREQVRLYDRCLQSEDDEPSLGFCEPLLSGAEHDFWFAYKSKDAAQHETTPAECTDREGDDHDGREDDHDAEDDRSDFEPSLGAHSTDERSQEHWAQGDREDREGYDCDMEPSLCGVGGHEFQPQPSATCRDLDLEADEVMACAL